MMNCWRTQNLVAPFLDGVLPETESELFEEHVEGCPDCQELVADLAGLPEITRLTLPSEAEQTVLDELSFVVKQRIAAARPTISEEGDDLISEDGGLLNFLHSGKLRVSVAGAATYAAAVVLLAAGIGINHHRVQDLEGSLAERDAIINSLSQRVVLAESGAARSAESPTKALAQEKETLSTDSLLARPEQFAPSTLVGSPVQSPPTLPWGTSGKQDAPVPVSMNPEGPRRTP